MDTINEPARRGVIADALAPRLRAASGPARSAVAVLVTARLGRRALGAKPLLPGTSLPAHRRVLTT